MHSAAQLIPYSALLRQSSVTSLVHHAV